MKLSALPSLVFMLFLIPGMVNSVSQRASRGPLMVPSLGYQIINYISIWGTSLSFILLYESQTLYKIENHCSRKVISDKRRNYTTHGKFVLESHLKRTQHEFNLIFYRKMRKKKRNKGIRRDQLRRRIQTKFYLDPNPQQYKLRISFAM